MNPIRNTEGIAGCHETVKWMKRDLSSASPVTSVSEGVVFHAATRAGPIVVHIIYLICFFFLFDSFSFEILFYVRERPLCNQIPTDQGPTVQSRFEICICRN